MVVDLRGRYENIKNSNLRSLKTGDEVKDVSQIKVNGFKPSSYQLAVFNFVANEKGSLVVEAVAGAAKTSTIVSSLQLVEEHNEVLFCAFNKRIVDTLAEKVPDNVTVKTMNALGHGAWMGFVGSRVPLEEGKIRRLVSELIEEAHQEGNMEKANNAKRMRTEIKRGVDVARALGVVPYDKTDLNIIIPSSEIVWGEIVEEFGITFNVDKKNKIQNPDQDEYDIHWFALLCEEILTMSIDQCRKAIDFNDQLYLPVIFDVRTKKYDVVFVDETQDISLIQRFLIKKFVSSTGRVVAVGDSKQAIYGWRGADSSSMESFAREFNCIKLPLSISYRCPKLVVNEAKKIVSHIEPFELAANGVVKDIGFLDSVKIFKAKDLVLCRVNSFLIDIAYRMIKEKVKFKYVGSNIQSGIVNLINSFDVTYVNSIPEKLKEWHQKKADKKLKKNPDADLSDLDDKHDTVLMIVINTTQTLVDNLIEELKYVFGDRDESTSVILSSIHRAKGSEADRVFALNSWLIPSKHAKKPWQIEQEYNLKYVMVTRAKKELYFVSTKKKDF